MMTLLTSRYGTHHICFFHRPIISHSHKTNNDNHMRIHLHREDEKKNGELHKGKYPLWNYVNGLSLSFSPLWMLDPSPSSHLRIRTRTRRLHKCFLFSFEAEKPSRSERGREKKEPSLDLAVILEIMNCQDEPNEFIFYIRLCAFFFFFLLDFILLRFSFFPLTASAAAAAAASQPAGIVAAPLFFHHISCCESLEMCCLEFHV